MDSMSVAPRNQERALRDSLEAQPKLLAPFRILVASRDEKYIYSAISHPSISHIIKPIPPTNDDAATNEIAEYFSTAADVNCGGFWAILWLAGTRCRRATHTICGGPFHSTAV